MCVCPGACPSQAAACAFCCGGRRHSGGCHRYLCILNLHFIVHAALLVGWPCIPGTVGDNEASQESRILLVFIFALDTLDTLFRLVSNISAFIFLLAGVQLQGVLDELCSYEGPLGATLAQDSIQITVWAPTAQQVFPLTNSYPVAQHAEHCSICEAPYTMST